MKKANIQFFKDGNQESGDLIIVIKDCDKSIEDLISGLLGSVATIIPSLEPPVPEEIVKPNIPSQVAEVSELPLTESTVPETVLGGICPNCGESISLDENGASCKSCNYSLPRIFCKRVLTDDELLSLIKGKTEVLDGFISGSGKPFKARLILKANKVKYEFE